MKECGNGQFPTSNAAVLCPGPYADPGYLQMALGAYLTPSSSGYKSVDPYFLSQGKVSPTGSRETREVVAYPPICAIVSAGIFSGANFFPGGGCSVPSEIALGLGMGVNALRHCRRRKARTVFSDPQLTGLEKRFEAQRFVFSEKILIECHEMKA